MTPITLETLDGSVSDLATCSVESLSIPDESLVAFSAIHHVASDPVISQKNEVCSIDKLISGGIALYSLETDSFVHHLTQEVVSDAMIDFTRLTSAAFVEMVGQYVTHLSQSLSVDESTDEIMREFSELANDAPVAAESHTQPRLSVDDILNGWHWSAVCEFKEFVGNSLKMKLELLRTGAG